MAQVKIEAPAKINLVLEVTGKRNDDYHEICTILQTISVCDVVTLKEIKSGVTLSGTRLNLIHNSDNLAYKAASLFLKSSKIKKGVDIHIEKNIPIGAGLGGGSSNAASVLLGLNKMWNVGFTKNQLKKIGVRIGMDVPFFIEGGRAYATRRGEIVKKITPFPSFWVLLIDPGFQISTRWAYKNIDSNLLLTKNNSYAKIMLNAIKGRSVEKIADSLFNTFEELIKKKYPNFLENTKSKLIDAGAIGTLMTGSGPVVFGIVKERRDAYQGYKILKNVVKERTYLAKTQF